jgi:hypothetical protein
LLKELARIAWEILALYYKNWFDISYFRGSQFLLILSFFSISR